MRGSAWRPQEGFGAWVAVGAGFLSMAMVFGVAYTFGVFVQPMIREFHVGTGTAAGVFSITAFLYFGLGPLTGALADRHGARLLGLLAAIAMGAGLALASLSDRLWLSFVTYGLGVGIGTACGYVPMVAAVGRRFVRRRALAVGLAVTGIGAGTLVLPPVAAVLIAQLGWRDAYRVLAVVSFVVLLACAIGIGPSRPAGHREPPGPSLLRSRPFTVMYVATLLLSQSLWIAFVYLVPYAQSIGISQVSAAFLVSAIGVGSIAGRLALGPLAERFTPLAAMKITVGLMFLSFALWVAGAGYAVLVAFGVLLGFGQGGWVAIAPTVMASMFGTRSLGRTVGTLWTAAGVGALLGPPLGGVIIDARGFRLATVGAFVLAAAGCALITAIREPAPAPALKAEASATRS